MRGGALCAESSAAETSSSNREPILDNVSINHSKIWRKQKQAQQNASHSGRWDGHGNFNGSRTLRTAYVQGSDYIEIFLSRNGRCVREEKGCRGHCGGNFCIRATAH